MIRIVVVGREPVVSAGIRVALESSADLRLVADRIDARSGFVAIDEEKPDLVVMDVALCGMNGIAATREIKRRVPDTRVLLLSAQACARDAAEGLAAGADGFAVKTEPLDSLLQAFRTVARGGRYVTPDLRGLRFAMAWGAGNGKLPARSLDVLASLSTREREVLDLVVKGLRNRDIARELCLSTKTIETHRSRINRKLGCAGTGDLVRFAADNGLLHSAHDRNEPAGGSRIIVLLVDDDPGLREAILREMTAQGYEPTHAPTVTSALSDLRTNPCASLFLIDAADRSVPAARMAVLLPERSG